MPVEEPVYLTVPLLVSVPPFCRVKVIGLFDCRVVLPSIVKFGGAANDGVVLVVMIGPPLKVSVDVPELEPISMVPAPTLVSM